MTLSALLRAEVARRILPRMTHGISKVTRVICVHEMFQDDCAFRKLRKSNHWRVAPKLLSSRRFEPKLLRLALSCFPSNPFERSVLQPHFDINTTTMQINKSYFSNFKHIRNARSKSVIQIFFYQSNNRYRERASQPLHTARPFAVQEQREAADARDTSAEGRVCWQH